MREPGLAPGPSHASMGEGSGRHVVAETPYSPGQGAQARGDDLWTLAALGVLAACLSAVLHEGIGHGGACLASGGHIVQLSSVYFACSQARYATDLAGPAANVLAGGLAYLAARGTGLRSRPTLRLGLLVFAAFNLLWTAGYLIYGGLLGIGDWAFPGGRIAQGLPGGWRPYAVALGVIFYWGVLRGVRRVISDASEGLTAGRLRRRLIAPYVAGAVCACVAALWAKAPGSIVQSALEFGGASVGLLLVRPSVAQAAAHPAAAVPISRAPLLWATAALVFLAWTATFGRGMP